MGFKQPVTQHLLGSYLVTGYAAQPSRCQSATHYFWRMLARLVGRAALRSSRIGSALPAIGIARTREQPNNLLQLAGGAALLSVVLSSDKPASCGKRGPTPAAKKAAAQPAAPKAKGKGPIKRTPTSAFDPAAKDDDIYQCEKIVGQRLARTSTPHCAPWASSRRWRATSGATVAYRCLASPSTL